MHKMKKRFLIVLSVLALALTGCATFEGDIPVDAGWETEWLSPANGDGVYDQLKIDVEVPSIKGLRIQAYRFIVTDNLGRTTFIIEETLAPGDGGRGNMDSLNVPDAFIWDGRTSNGAWAPDGEYKFRIEATGQKGVKGSSSEGTVIVDNTAPSLVLSVPFLSFSPNGDGRQDVLPVYLVEASVEDLWKGEILDSGSNVVRSTEWKDLPRSSEWDGTDQNGRRLEDGLYEYRVSSTDKAGNTFFLNLGGISLDTAPSSLTLERSESVISPNGDGVLDGLSLTPALQRQDGLLSWTIAVVDTGGEVRRSWSGAGAPSPVVFDGRDDAGRRLVDGDYYGILSAEYSNGDVPRTASAKFAVDTTPPSAVFSAEYLLFSPDGDGRRDSVMINQSSSAEDIWNARILDARGRIVRTGEWSTRMTPFEWDGRDSAGLVVPDGLYIYEARAVDRGGNAYTGRINGIRVDSRPTPVTLSASSGGLSPNGDGTAESILFIPAPVVRDGISGWTFQVSNDAAGVSWNLSGVSGEEPPEAIEWMAAPIPRISWMDCTLFQ
jgi:flagellar hook assembly protein FlgD